MLQRPPGEFLGRSGPKAVAGGAGKSGGPGRAPSLLGASWSSTVCHGGVSPIAASVSRKLHGVGPVVEETEETGRLFNCRRCGKQVRICRKCDRGNIYCGKECSKAARLEAQRRSGAVDRGKKMVKRMRSRRRGEDQKGSAEAKLPGLKWPHHGSQKPKT
jgi:hypothetical protein